MEVKLMGLDIAKRVFQVCGVDESGVEIVRKRLGRESVLPFFAALAPTTIGMEACATAHHWGRLLRDLGHDVRLLPPRYVKSYVWRNKTDAADAAAICAALGDPRIHAVPVKSETQQAVLGLHRARDLLVRQRTQLGNALRALLAEFGVIAPQGQAGLKRLRVMAETPGSAGLPEEVAPALASLVEQWTALDGRVRGLERAIVAWHRGNAMSRDLATIPGIGPITASAMAATVGDVRVFRTARHFSAWIGMTPREQSSALTRRRGAITKQGNAYLRRLLVLGAHARMRHHRPGEPGADPWLTELRARRGTCVAAVALANKMARIAWALMTRGESDQPRHAGA